MHEVSKSHLDDLSKLVFDGYLTVKMPVFDSYITLKTLEYDDRQRIYDRYQDDSGNGRLNIIFDLLSLSIDNVGGHKIYDRKEIRYSIARLHSVFISILYEKYLELDKKMSNLNDKLEYFIETPESKNNWVIYRKMGKSIEASQLNKMNQFLKNWILMNLNKDWLDTEKKEWNKIEFMTSSICSFVNSKAFNANKKNFKITERYKEIEEMYEDRRIVVEEILNSDGKKVFDIRTNANEVNSSVFSSIKRNPNESEQEHIDRVNDMMHRHNSGEVVDEHDRIIREFDINRFKKMVLGRRIKTEVARHLKKLKRMSQSDEDMNVTILESSVKKVDVKESVNLDYHYDGVNYVDIASNKIFGMVPKKELKEAFDEVVRVPFDMDKAISIYHNQKKKSMTEVSAESVKKDDIVEKIASLKEQSPAEMAMNMNFDESPNKIKGDENG